MVGARALTADEIARGKKKRSELFEQWSTVKPGATLELQFEVAGEACPYGDPLVPGPGCPFPS